jgi:hypothetical protein
MRTQEDLAEAEQIAQTEIDTIATAIGKTEAELAPDEDKLAAISVMIEQVEAAYANGRPNADTIESQSAAELLDRAALSTARESAAADLLKQLREKARAVEAKMTMPRGRLRELKRQQDRARMAALIGAYEHAVYTQVRPVVQKALAKIAPKLDAIREEAARSGLRVPDNLVALLLGDPLPNRSIVPDGPRVRVRFVANPHPRGPYAGYKFGDEIDITEAELGESAQLFQRADEWHRLEAEGQAAALATKSAEAQAQDPWKVAFQADREAAADGWAQKVARDAERIKKAAEQRRYESGSR